MREVLGPAWNECFKFAFIRNPWDLMVSSYHWWLTYAEIFPALHKDVAQIREMGSFSVFIRSEFDRELIRDTVPHIHEWLRLHYLERIPFRSTWL